MARQPTHSRASATMVSTRRAYFDCRFGQLHVRTAFPATGGFDEGVTFFCLHPSAGASRTFERFLPEMADIRSVYAPDLPGFGESDPAPEGGTPDAANAVADLAGGLRLHHIDVLGFGFGAAVAIELAAGRPELVRRLVLVGAQHLDRLPVILHACLVLRINPGASEDSKGSPMQLPNARFIDLPEHAADLFDASPGTLAKRISAFLNE